MIVAAGAVVVRVVVVVVVVAVGGLEVVVMVMVVDVVTLAVSETLHRPHHFLQCTLNLSDRTCHVAVALQATLGTIAHAVMNGVIVLAARSFRSVSLSRQGSAAVVKTAGTLAALAVAVGVRQMPHFNRL